MIGSKEICSIIDEHITLIMKRKEETENTLSNREERAKYLIEFYCKIMLRGRFRSGITGERHYGERRGFIR